MDLLSGGAFIPPGRRCPLEVSYVSQFPPPPLALSFPTPAEESKLRPIGIRSKLRPFIMVLSHLRHYYPPLINPCKLPPPWSPYPPPPSLFRSPLSPSSPIPSFPPLLDLLRTVYYPLRELQFCSLKSTVIYFSPSCVLLPPQSSFF